MYVWQCAAGSSLWTPFSWMAGLLILLRTLCTVLSGVSMDVYGRRRVAVVGLGVYFVFAFSRSFAPVVEVAIIAVVVEGAAAEAATMALVLLAVECSTQQESLRSACLVLLGHSLAVAAIVAPIHMLLSHQLWQQLAKSVPAVAFIVLLCWLPESVRWVLVRGDWADACFLFPRTHNISLDEVMKPKLVAVQQETERCLASAGCRGSRLRQALCPVLRTRQLVRLWLIGSLCAAVYGLAVGTRLLETPAPYNGLADRSLAFGVVELFVLLVVGLVLGRAGARTMVVFSMMVMAVTMPLSVVKSMVFISCVADVTASLVSHGAAVWAGVGLLVPLWRLCPTHSRGTLYGLVWAWAVLGYAAAKPYGQLMDRLDSYVPYFSLKVVVCTGACFVAGLLAILLPATPSVLPDALSHCTKDSFHEDAEDAMSCADDTLENTRL